MAPHRRLWLGLLMTARCAIAIVAVLMLPGLPVSAIETDQFYAWGRELTDATDILNAKVNSELSIALDRVKANQDCQDAARRISRYFRLLIFHDVELWANNTSLIGRIPATPDEELRYRREYLYGNHGPFDVGTWMPPSPTIEVAGVRFGTDKLTHFFSEGWMAFRWYRKGLEKGLSPEAAERRAIKRGVLVERSLLGAWSSGVFSLADLEANYVGMRFFAELCEGDAPMLRRTDDGWEMASRFDFRDYVSPEWDESYQPPVFTRRRWKKVRPVMLGYCSRLELPEVVRQRGEYARRDRYTLTEQQVDALIDEQKLTDPETFAIDRVCAESEGG
jgi:hypothetical protein